MRKFLSVLLIAGLLLLAAPAYAQSRYGLFTAACEEQTALLLPAKTWVYGISIFGDEALSFMGIYDTDSLVTATAATLQNEAGVAAQFDTHTKMYAQPVYFVDGVTVVISLGVAFVYYGPAP